jgi:NADPH:quinone reductase-like Zn-dependent oxidoreductase
VGSLQLQSRIPGEMTSTATLPWGAASGGLVAVSPVVRHGLRCRRWVAKPAGWNEHGGVKAIYYEEYGRTDEVLALRDVPRPRWGDDEVLVRVHASSVNSWDYENVVGEPGYVRPVWGLTKPKLNVLGADVAGTVAAVGPHVKRFAPGDAVFGDLCEGQWGGFGEYTVAREEALTAKPDWLSFTDAAATPQAGCMALQGLHQGRIRSGQRVLINGAGGAVGSFAIQIARTYDVELTAVDRSDKFELMRSLGADRCLDYRHQDYTATGDEYDLILEVTGRRSVFAYERALRRGGRFVLLGASVPTIVETLTLGWALSLTRDKHLRLVPARANYQLATLLELFAAGRVRPVIDQIFPLEQTPLALQRLGDGNTCGKAVIQVLPPDAKA